MDYLLSLVIFFPSFGAIILGIFLRAENIESNKNAKLLSLVTTFATFIFSLFVIYNFNSDESNFQLVEEYEWLMGLTYKVGIDGISLPLVILTTVTMPIVIISSWKIENKVKEWTKNHKENQITKYLFENKNGKRELSQLGKIMLKNILVFFTFNIISYPLWKYFIFAKK